MKYLDLQEAKDVYKKGKNITQYLRKKLNQKNNTSEIIKIAHDLQAGSYIEYVKLNVKKTRLYTNELSQILNQHIAKNQSLLDVGTGELTTLTLLLNQIKKNHQRFLHSILAGQDFIKAKSFLKKI